MDQPSSTESNAITLRIRFKSASLDEFIGRYGADVSPGGIFIRTKQPVEVGTTLQFDFSLADGSALLCGTGTVAWVRESDPVRANSVPGMGLRFDKLTAESQHTHQVILAEKARKEGKVSSTPYPPTSFVAPASRVSPPPEAAKPASEPEPEPKAQPGPVNFAVTRPAPAAAVQPPAPATAPVAASPSVAGSPFFPVDVDEFSESGKTEVSDKPLDYYLKEAAAAKEPAQERGQPLSISEDAATQPGFDDLSADGMTAPITKSGPPPEGYDLTDSGELAADKPASAQPAAPQRKSGSREAFAALLNLGAEGKPGETQNAAPAEEVLQELSGGAPIEETVPEKTEEVATSPVSAPLPGPETLDLGTGLESGFTEAAPTRDAIRLQRPKGSMKAVAAIAVVAGAAAFGAVYLAKTKPWQEQAKPEAVVASPTPSAESPPAVTPPAKPIPEPAKPGADRPAAAAPKVAAADQAPKKEEGKSADKGEAAGDKAAIEKAAAAKLAQAEAGSGRLTGKSGAKPGGTAGEKPVAAGAEQAHRLVVKSTPISAEVLIDGEYFSRTPCERRILDPSKAFTVVVRKEGYEQDERVVGPSANWVKKGEDQVLTVVARLRRARHSAASPPPVVAPEVKVEKKPEAGLASPASLPRTEPAKPVAKEPAKPVVPVKATPASPGLAPPVAAPPAPAALPVPAKPAPPVPAKATPAPPAPAALPVPAALPAPAKPTPAAPAKVAPAPPAPPAPSAPAKAPPAPPAPAKPAPAAPPAPAKPAPAAPAPPAPSAKPEPAKPAPAPAAGAAYKPAPNFDEQGKTK